MTDKQVVKFGDIAEQVIEIVTPQKGDEKSFIGLQHLESESLNINEWGDDVELSTQAFKVNKGDIIFARRNTYLKRVAISPINGICSADAMVIRPLGRFIEPAFLPFFMQTNTFMDRAISISAGSLSSRVKWKALSEQEFCIPSKKEQQYFIDVSNRLLSGELALNSAINSAKKLYNLVASRQILGGNNYRSFFGKEEQIIPKGWRFVNLGDVLTRVQYGTSKALHDTGEIPVLRMMNIEDGRVTNSELRYSKLSINEFESIKLYKGDILFNRTNSIDLVGKTGIFMLEGDYAFASYMLRLNVNTDLVTPEFVNSYLNLPLVQYRLKAYATPGVSQANINPKSLKSLPFLLPPLDQIKETDALLRTINGSFHSLTVANAQHKTIQRTLRETILGS